MEYATDTNLKSFAKTVNTMLRGFNDDPQKLRRRTEQCLQMASFFDHYVIAGCGDETVVEAVMVTEAGEFLAVLCNLGKDEVHKTLTGDIREAPASFAGTLNMVREKFLADQQRPLKHAA